MKGMILTAGLGTRLKPLTNKKPKALVKIGDYHMLDLAIAYLNKHGVEDIIINVHHFADQLMEYVAEKRWQGFKLSISDETNTLLNTGGGLKKAHNFLETAENFVLMAVDVLTNLNLSAMIEAHLEKNALVTLAVKERKTSRDLLFDKNENLAGWKHNETGEVKSVNGRVPDIGLGFSGIHVINNKLFELMDEEGSFSIVDLYLRIAASEEIKMFNHSGDKWIEFGRAEKIDEQSKSKEFIELTNTLFN